MLLPTGFHTFVGFPIFHVQFCLVCSPSVLNWRKSEDNQKLCILHSWSASAYAQRIYIPHLESKVLGIKNEILMLVLELVVAL